jgi:beta-N-acetylglucosaminidase
VAKCRHVRELGAERIELLWDDVEHELPEPGDLERYGDAERPSGAAQADLTNRFLGAFPQDAALVVCPMGYAGTEETPYRRSFGGALDPSILVYWTGPEVVSQTISRDDLDAAVRAFGHELVLWDNYPVNDFDRERLFLGPLRGRDPGLAGGMLAGIVANGMLQAVPSKLPLATVADWALDPFAYEPLASFERALRTHGAEVVDALARLAAPAALDAPAGLDAVVEALVPGVDAATALALLGPFA